MKKLPTFAESGKETDEQNTIEHDDAEAKMAHPSYRVIVQELNSEGEPVIEETFTNFFLQGSRPDSHMIILNGIFNQETTIVMAKNFYDISRKLAKSVLGDIGGTVLGGR